MSNKVIPFKNQDYSLLKKKHDRHNLFVDSYFPSSIKSICHSSELEVNYQHFKIEWKRPSVCFIKKKKLELIQIFFFPK
jgi:hypothetical protein